MASETQGDSGGGSNTDDDTAADAPSSGEAADPDEPDEDQMRKPAGRGLRLRA